MQLCTVAVSGSCEKVTVGPIHFVRVTGDVSNNHMAMEQCMSYRELKRYDSYS